MLWRIVYTHLSPTYHTFSLTFSLPIVIPHLSPISQSFNQSISHSVSVWPAPQIPHRQHTSVRYFLCQQLWLFLKTRACLGGSLLLLKFKWYTPPIPSYLVSDMALASFIQGPKQHRWTQVGLPANTIYKVPNTISSWQLKPHNLE